MSIESNGIFCWIFLPIEYSIGYSVWYQSVNRIFFWIFYSILFLLLTKYYVRFSIWYLRVPNANGIFYRIFCRISYRIFDRLAWTVLCCTLWTLLSTVLFEQHCSGLMNQQAWTMLFQQFISSMITDLFYVVSTGVNKVVGTARIMLDISIVLYHVEYIIFFLSRFTWLFLVVSRDIKIHNIFCKTFITEDKWLYINYKQPSGRYRHARSLNKFFWTTGLYSHNEMTCLWRFSFLIRLVFSGSIFSMKLYKTKINSQLKRQEVWLVRTWKRNRQTCMSVQNKN